MNDTAYIDAEWSAGYVGLYNWWYAAVAQEFDDVKVGFDNNSDGDILDAGDAIRANDDFNSNVVNLVYDDTIDRAALRQRQAGNLTLDTPHPPQADRSAPRPRGDAAGGESRADAGWRVRLRL